MRTILLESRYKRDLKRAKRNPQNNMLRLESAILALASDGYLPERFLPHPLSGDFRPAWECHIQPDFLLIYELTPDDLILVRCGSHSQLFK